MTEGTTATGGVLTRRTVAAAALWSVPVVSLAMPAPAYAISPGQCVTMTWTSGSVTGRNTAYTTASYSATTNSINGQNVSVRVASSVTSGGAAGYVDGGMVFNSSNSKASNRNFVAYSAGLQHAVGTQGATQGQGTGFSVPSGTTSSVLVLNQGTSGNARASQTLNFTFGGTKVPKSVSMNIYDITAATSAHTANGQYQYTDRVAFSGGTVSAGAAVGPAVTTSGSTLTGTTPSTNAGGYVPVTVTNLSNSSSLSLTYSNPGTVTSGGGTQMYNTQYIAIGDVRICY